MKATVKVEFNEQSKAVTSQTKVELEGEVEREDQLSDIIKLAKAEARDLALWGFTQSQELTRRK